MASIAVVGSGRIGGNLARKWATKAHLVVFGVRDPDNPALVDSARQLGVGRAPIDEAVRRSDVVTFAIPGGAMAETVAGLGRQLDGKVVIDAANNVGGEHTNSAAAFAAAAPGAAYYRAFNSYGWEVVEQPVVEGTQPDAFYCGPDGASRSTIEQLIADVGLRPVWLGGPDQVEVVDGVLRLWFTLVRQGHGRHMALRLLED